MSFPNRAAIICTSFYPPLAGRCNVAASLPELDLIGIQYYVDHPDYSWFARAHVSFPVITMFEGRAAAPFPSRLRALFRSCLKAKASAFFFYQYNLPEQFLCALALRAAGKTCFAMYDSTFQDYPRRSTREALKALALKPYNGAIAASTRTRDYLRFLGFGKRPIVLNNCNIDMSRIAPSTPESDEDFLTRDFVIVARLVAKKNVGTAISAFKQYCIRRPDCRRRLKICGDGPLRQELEAQAEREAVADRVDFLGYCSPSEASDTLRTAVLLLLLSTEEQFGIVILEALAHGVPVLVSNRCGACDDFVVSGANGFIIEPDNVAGAARFMGLVTSSFEDWKGFSAAAYASARRGDAIHFGRSLVELLVRTAACKDAEGG